MRGEREGNECEGFKKGLLRVKETEKTVLKRERVIKEKDTKREMVNEVAFKIL